MRYWADRQIFLKDAKLALDTLHQRARQTAFLVPGLTIVVRDEYGLGEGGSKGEESFRFDGGISEFCEFLASDRPVCDTLRFTGQGSFKETVPVLDEHGQMTPTEVTRELGVDVAMRWGPATRRPCARSSTSSPPPRAAPTSRASSRPSPRR